MEPWLLYSLLAMLFAGLTSILAKVGLKDISSDLGLAIRTGVVFIIVIANSFLLGNVNEIGKLTPKTILFLVISGITTSLSVSYTHLRAHETVLDLVCRLLLEKKKT